MNTQAVSQAGWSGIREGMRQADDAAARIASAATRREPSELGDALVQLGLAEQQAVASARVVEAGNDTLGTLLDTFA